METYLYVAQIVVAVALILVSLLQVRGGGLGGIFGQADTVFRTKRGGKNPLPAYHRPRSYIYRPLDSLTQGGVT